MMERSKCSEQQIAFLLRQAEEGTNIIDSIEKSGIEWCSNWHSS